MGLNVIIVGAGIGGLTAAIALRKSGHKVTVLEKYGSKREVGFAVSIPPNSSRVLRSLGVDFVKSRLTKWKGLDMIKSDVTPVQWLPRKDIDTEKEYGAPFLCAHRVDLHDYLWGLAIGEGPGEPARIQESSNVIAFDAAGTVKLQSGETLTGDLVVAADGIKSIAHAAVIGEERPATLSSLNSIRFVVPTKTLLENPKTAEVFTKGDLRASVFFSTTNKVGIFRSPCRDNTLQNFGVYDINDKNRTAEETWIKKADQETALQVLEKFDESIREIVRCADENEMYLWKVADRDPLEKIQRDRLVLLGDACHPMGPHHGQGASQSIEDAGVLGIVMEGVNDPSEVPARLQLWETLRKDRVSIVQLLSKSEGMALVLTDDTVQKLKQIDHTIEEQVPGLTRPSAFHWFFKYDCLAEAEKAVKKHQSS